MSLEEMAYKFDQLAEKPQMADDCLQEISDLYKSIMIRKLSGEGYDELDITNIYWWQLRLSEVVAEMVETVEALKSGKSLLEEKDES